MKRCPGCGAKEIKISKESLTCDLMNVARIRCLHCDFSVERFDYSEQVAWTKALEAWCRAAKFTYVDITSPGCEGMINLFFGDHCIALISNLNLAKAIKTNIEER